MRLIRENLRSIWREPEAECQWGGSPDEAMKIKANESSDGVDGCRLVGGLVVLVLIPMLLGWAPLPVANDPLVRMPGTQSGDAELPSISACSSCHAGFDPVTEPMHAWQGSMMAQATRDPLWLACMTVAEQDSIWAVGTPNAGDLCIRCHTPQGWFGGRSDPPNGANLSVAAGDFEGVNCAACHRLMDPFPGLGQPELPPETDPVLIAEAALTRAADVNVLKTHTLFNGSPFFDEATGLPVHHGPAEVAALTAYIEAGSGQMFVESGVQKGNFRGPRSDADTNAKHSVYYARFHQSQAVCRTCHDVSNPVLANLVVGPGTSERQSAASYFHVERTSSEFELSAYATLGGAEVEGPLRDRGITRASDCQDCHMPRADGRFAKQGSLRSGATGVATHALSGGNAWMTRILATLDAGAAVHDPINEAILSGSRYPGASIELAGVQGNGGALLDGEARALGMLRSAATVQAVSDSERSAVLRIVNHTGHKLISGFPEGRRMWLHVEFLAADGSTISEINPYEPLVITTDGGGFPVYQSGGDLTVTEEALVYETKMSSSLTGESKTFHFVLATDRHKDNRIPPKGFLVAGATDRLVQPQWQGAPATDYFSAAEYAGGYDEVVVNKPPGTVGWKATLYYQTTSKAYIEFLRDEINGTGATLSSPTPSSEPEAYIAQSDPFFATQRDWGDAIWELWLHNGGAVPVPMTQAISPPSGLEVLVGTGGVALRFPGIPGRVYQVEANEDLDPAHWRAVGEEVSGTGGLITVPDPEAGVTDRLFYRVVCWEAGE